MIEAEGWKPLDPVKGASWSEEETEMLYSIEAKCVAYDNDTVVNVRKHLAMVSHTFIASKTTFPPVDITGSYSVSGKSGVQKNRA